MNNYENRTNNENRKNNLYKPESSLREYRSNIIAKNEPEKEKKKTKLLGGR